MTFDSLGLSADLLRTVAEEGYIKPTPVQAAAIPHVLRVATSSRRRRPAPARLPPSRCRSSTGSGSMQHELLARAPPGPGADPRPDPRARRPGRRGVRTYGRTVPLRATVVYGGVPIEPQTKILQAGVEILVATPGRLLDHVQQRTVNLSQVSILVLDEADRMLDMGFLPDIRKILALLPARRQNLLFSATFDDEVRRLSATILNDPATIEVAPRNTAAEAVRQLVYPVDRDRKEELLIHLLRTLRPAPGAGLHADQDRRHPARDAPRPRGPERGGDPLGSLPARADARARGLQAGDVACSWRPTSRHAGSTSRTCRSSSTSSSRGSRRTTSTGSAGPAGPGATGRRSRWSAWTRPISCGQSSGCCKPAIPWTVEVASCPSATPSRARSAGCQAAGKQRRITPITSRSATGRQPGVAGVR